jgi:tetratricopeptide (TPR) repeat protein
MGAHDQAITVGQRALALATASRDPILQALAHQYLGITYQAQGDYGQAIACLTQAAAVFAGAQRQERSGQTQLPAVLSRANLARCHAELGSFAEGRRLGEAGLGIAEEMAHPASLMTAYQALGLLDLRQGHVSQALPWFERAMSLCRDADLRAMFPGQATTLGAAYTMAGRFDDAVALLTQALEHATAMARDPQVHLRLCLGEAQRRAGRLEDAQALAEQALALARERQERGNGAYALRLLGDIAAHRIPPDVTEATIHYRQALALAEELGMRPLQAHCHRSLGMLYAATGQRTLAHAELSATIDLYRAMEMTFWLPETEAALAQVEA